MPFKIEIYTRKNCAYSQRTKELLHIKGVEFIEHDITNNARMAEQMRLRSGHQTAPEVFVNDVLVGGCPELFDLDEKGLLDGVLGLSIPSGKSFQPI
jgi:glutaredoxin 3